MKKNVWFFGLLMAMVNVGCIKTTRVILDKEGKPVEEVTTWEPLAVPVVYGGPVVVYDDYYRPPTVVYERYERPYYRSPRVYYDTPRHGYHHHHRPHHRHR